MLVLTGTIGIIMCQYQYLQFRSKPTENFDLYQFAEGSVPDLAMAAEASFGESFASSGFLLIRSGLAFGWYIRSDRI